MSKAEFPNQIPVKPPEINKLTNPIANNIPGVKRILPLHKVVNQLNTLIAEGTAINKVNKTNTDPKNGFNPVTNIKYALPEDSYITIKVFDITGKEITTLIYDSFRPAGIYTVMFDAGKYNLTSGIYFYRIIAVSTISNKTYTDIKKMIFTK